MSTQHVSEGATTPFARMSSAAHREPASHPRAGASDFKELLPEAMSAHDVVAALVEEARVGASATVSLAYRRIRAAGQNAALNPETLHGFREAMYAQMCLRRVRPVGVEVTELEHPGRRMTVVRLTGVVLP